MAITTNTTATPNMVEVLSVDNPVMKSYIFYCSLLCLKVLFMPLIIGRYRFTKWVFISEEDSAFVKRWLGINAVTQRDDADVERVRRAHLNDLENIPLFLIVALMYLFCKPDPRVASILFLVYTIARFIHTIVYAVFVIPQPTRAIVFFIGICIHLYLSFVVVTQFASYAIL